MEEQYLTISLFGGQIKLNVWKNNDRNAENPSRPHFKGDGVAVWVNKKKPKPTEPTQPINYEELSTKNV